MTQIKSVFKKTSYISVFTVFTITIGSFFRFYNLNWDKGHSFHSDERNLTNAVTKIQFFSQLNPGFFSYGSFPVYLYKFGTLVAAAITRDQSWLFDWTKITIIGRFFSALFSTLTLIVVFLLTRRVFSPLAALLATWFTAFMPLLIQVAHYSITESMITFWAVLLTYRSLKQNKFNWVESGIILGLAMATKVSSVSFIFILFSGYKTLTMWKFLRISLLSLIVYVIVSPYTFLDWQNFIKAMNYESNIALGKNVFVYVYQFIGTRPYLFQIKQFAYTQGLLTAVLSLFGIVYVAYKIFRYRMWKLGFIFLWPLLYFLYVGNWFAKFVRYLIPIYPFFAIAAAIGVTDFIGLFRKKRIQYLLIGIICISSMLPTFAFFHIYTAEQTRIQASKWIYQNIPHGSKILTEHWDEGLPIPLDHPYPPLSIYMSESLTIYEPDNDQKIQYYANKLSTSDYVIINSRRLYGTLIRLTDKYPITSTYYKRLFDGTLGYNKVSEFSVYPHIKLGPWVWEINDDGAEESFQVYDHPKVLIFQNTKYITQDVLLQLLTPRL